MIIQTIDNCTIVFCFLNFVSFEEDGKMTRGMCALCEAKGELSDRPAHPCPLQPSFLL